MGSTLSEVLNALQLGKIEDCQQMS